MDTPRMHLGYTLDTPPDTPWINPGFTPDTPWIWHFKPFWTIFRHIRAYGIWAFHMWHVGCPGTQCTVAKTWNQPILFGPKEFSMDSCLCHTYTHEYAFSEITSRGFSGSMAFNSWGMCQTKPEIIFGIFFLVDYACNWGVAFTPKKNSLWKVTLYMSKIYH